MYFSEMHKQLKEELIEIAKRAVSMGLQSGSGGNISIRIPGEDSLLIKPSSIGFLQITKDNLILVDFDGNIINGDGKPSRDVDTHIGVYRERPEINGIIHTHAPYSLMFAIRNKEIPFYTEEPKFKLRKVPLVKPTEGLYGQDAESVVSIFKDKQINAALLGNHGIIAAAETLTQAQNYAELVEDSAKVAYMLEVLNRQHS